MATPDELTTPPGASLDGAAPWLSVAAAAAALGVAPRTVRRRIERGQLAGISVALDGGGRAWLVSLEIGGDEKTGDRADSEWTANGQRAANRADSVANRSNKREIERTDSKAAAVGESNGQRAANRSDIERTATGAPIEREPTRREIEQQEEIRFLRGTIEQLQRDGAEVRAALRAALKLAAPASSLQLTAGGDAPTSNGAPLAADREQFKPPDPTTGDKSGAAPLTYGDIADALERAGL